VVVLRFDIAQRRGGVDDAARRGGARARRDRESNGVGMRRPRDAADEVAAARVAGATKASPHAFSFIVADDDTAPTSAAAAAAAVRVAVQTSSSTSKWISAPSRTSVPCASVTRSG